jgi:hypothetical protein
MTLIRPKHDYRRQTVTTTAYNSTTSQRDSVRLEIAIDWERFARRLADKAYRNKSGRMEIMNGILKARILKDE